MNYQSPYDNFIFEGYSFDEGSLTATFNYSFDGKLTFQEQVIFSTSETNFNREVLDAALQLAFYLTGTSYYKTFPTKTVLFNAAAPNRHQDEFLNEVYTQGLSQFIFENNLNLDQIVKFKVSSEQKQAVDYIGEGLLALQSGGKDSLLMAALLNEKQSKFQAVYVSSTDGYPSILEDIGGPVHTIKRVLGREDLAKASEQGALDGHVPVTYIISAYSLIDAILHNENQVILSIGTEGEEPHEYVGDMPVNHQWSKTWQAEQLLTDYVHSHISPDLNIGSPLRGYSELKIAELFVKKCWHDYGHRFSSCNLANYKQGKNNDHLTWCGECPKCANSYLLFAPFLEPQELQRIFGGQDLFKKPLLTETFKGLLGIDGVMKPFECVGETAELRLAYHMARANSSEYELPFTVPESDFDYQKQRDSQAWAYALIA
mgnify:CR=1 FL=1